MIFSTADLSQLPPEIGVSHHSELIERHDLQMKLIVSIQLLVSARSLQCRISLVRCWQHSNFNKREPPPSRAIATRRFLLHKRRRQCENELSLPCVILKSGVNAVGKFMEIRVRVL
jgi:hypothetical protein